MSEIENNCVQICLPLLKPLNVEIFVLKLNMLTEKWLPIPRFLNRVVTKIGSAYNAKLNQQAI